MGTLTEQMEACGESKGDISCISDNPDKTL